MFHYVDDKLSIVYLEFSCSGVKTYMQSFPIMDCTFLLQDWCYSFTVADERDVLSSYKAMCSEVTQLLKEGLEDKTLSSLKGRLAAVQPQHLVSLFISFPIQVLMLFWYHLVSGLRLLFFWIAECHRKIKMWKCQEVCWTENLQCRIGNTQSSGQKKPCWNKASSLTSSFYFTMNPSYPVRQPD